MTKLEFIDREIKIVKNALEELSNFSIAKNALEKKLSILQQIKTDLEAWEELNKLFIIKLYYQDKENNKYPAIMIEHAIEHDFEYVRRGVKQESFNKFKKALEVEDEKNN